MRVGDRLPVFAAVLIIIGGLGYLRYTPSLQSVQDHTLLDRLRVAEETVAELEKTDVQRKRLAAAVAKIPLAADEEWRRELKM